MLQIVRQVVRLCHTVNAIKDFWNFIVEHDVDQNIFFIGEDKHCNFLEAQ